MTANVSSFYAERVRLGLRRPHCFDDTCASCGTSHYSRGPLNTDGLCASCVVHGRFRAALERIHGGTVGELLTDYSRWDESQETRIHGLWRAVFAPAEEQAA